MLYSPPPTWGQVSESYHWAIKFGELVLPILEGLGVEVCMDYMGVYLRFLLRLYMYALGRSNYILSRKIISIMSHLGDPYLPGICENVGWYDDIEIDSYLDEIDVYGN